MRNSKTQRQSRRYYVRRIGQCSALSLPYQPNGRFAFTRATSVPSTRAALARRRLRFALFVDNRWRRDGRALKTLPRAVILKRFATDLRVLLRAIGFGIRPET